MRLRLWTLMVLVACTANAVAGERRDIVFDCPCSAEWAPNASGDSGTLTIEAGIRSHRAVDSGPLWISADRSVETVGKAVARSVFRGRWSLPFGRPETDRAIRVGLCENSGQGSTCHGHEALALWPVPRETNDAHTAPSRFVDITTDGDGDGVGDVNERLAGTSPQDPESIPGETVVDVLAVYTDDFRDPRGYPDYARMLHVIAASSAIFEDSATNVRLRLAGMSEVDPGENGWTETADRERLMDKHGADVSLQFNRQGSCSGGDGGCAYIGAYRSAFWNDAQARFDGSSVLIATHELGHVMGLAHSALSSETYGAWRWSRGHHVSLRFEPQRGTLMTIRPSRIRMGVFSDPSAHCLRRPCGVAAHELDGADAVATLDRLRFQVGAHREPGKDSDGDGFVDAADAAPDDPGDWFDADTDGIGDNADADDDNDGVPDADDAFPLDAGEWADADQDGIGDNADPDVQELNLSPFRDPALRRAVETALGKANGAPITAADMASLTNLYASYGGIRDLAGLELASRLGRLWLDGNRVNDLSPLSGLRALRNLSLRENEVTDLAPLSRLPGLRQLDVSDNPVRDLEPLSALTGITSLFLNRSYATYADVLALPYFRQLSELGLAGLGVHDIRPLTGLTLRRLDLSGNRISNLEPLAGTKDLLYLNLDNNRVSDISALAGLTNLRTLLLNDNAIIDIAPLAGLVLLWELELARNGPISDIRPLERLVGLWSLDLRSNEISDVSPLATMTGLSNLLLSGNTIADISPLAELVGLRQLHVSSNRVTDLSPLAELASLESLFLVDNAISDIGPLAGLIRVQWLLLSENSISDIAAVSGMTDMQVLFMDDNAISDVAPLAGLVDLQRLNLVDNRIADVTALSEMTGLRWVDLSRNAITDIRPLTNRTVFGGDRSSGASLGLWYNPLNAASVEEHLPTIRSWGVRVGFDPSLPARVVSSISDPTLHSLVAETAGGLLSDDEKSWAKNKVSHLRVHGRGIASLAGLEAATSLRLLLASSNRVVDLSPLAELSELTGLDLRDNRISDLAPLVANEALGRGDWVALDGNPLSERSLNEHVPALLARGVDVGVGRIMLTLLAAGEPLRFEISGYLEAILGTVVTASVSVEDSLVEVDMDDSAVTVTPGTRSGQVAVTVTGENGGGEKHALTFAVTVRGPWVAPLVPNGTDPVRQGFVRVVNHGAEGAEARIAATDDAGVRRRGLTLALGRGAAAHFNSADLETGNADKGLAGASGRGAGDWRLEVESAADLSVASYIRTVDGFLTPMRNVMPTEPGVWDVAIFNPASNVEQVSSLRIANLGGERAEVAITGVDDQGRSPGSTVRIGIPGGATRTLTGPELESGSGDGRGRLGDGDGKWRLRVESESTLEVTNLLRSPEGHLTDLSTLPDALLGQGGVHTVPLLPSASDGKGRQGFVRVLNRTARDGEVEIAAFDDAGRAYQPLKLVLEAGRTIHFNSDDLELGNEAKGLSGSTGSGSGNWRLEMHSPLDIQVLAYVRTPGGFLTTMHDVVPRRGRRYEVAIFNPASNAEQVSSLRIVNPGSRPAHVSVAGIDDAGRAGTEVVRLSVAAGSARTLTSVELERGGWEQRGRLGDGKGKWRLQVDCEQPILLMNLLDSRTGHMTNLSMGPPDS